MANQIVAVERTRLALRRTLCAGVHLLLLGLALPAQAQTPVLTQSAATQLEQGFAQLPGDLTLTDAQVRADRVDVRICPRSGACAQLTLTHPRQPCTGERTPAFCVQFVGPQPPFAAEVLRAVARFPPTIWRATQHASPLPQLEARDDSPLRRHLAALAWLALWGLLPLLLGLLAGSLARRWPRLRKPCLALPLAPALLALVWPSLPFGDAVLMAVLGVLAAFWRLDAQPQRRQRWLLAGGLLALGLALLEISLRVAGPVPPLVQDSRMGFLQTPPLQVEPSLRGTDESVNLASWAEALCVDPAQFRVLRARAPRSPWVLHLGDSMLFGVGLTAAQAVPDQLAVLLPQWTHVNAGLPGSTIDLQFALLQRLLRAWPAPVAVVLHAYPGNDLDGLDEPLDVCGSQPVLSQPPQPVAVTCQPRVQATLRQRLLHAPLPLPIVRAAQWSWLARRLVAALQVAQSGTRLAQVQDPKQRYLAIAGALQQVLQRQQIPLLAVLMPVRTRIVPGGVTAARSLTQVFDSLGIPVLDSQALCDERMEPQAPLFLGPQDIHLAPQGAVRYAQWLAPHVERLLRPL